MVGSAVLCRWGHGLTIILDDLNRGLCHTGKGQHSNQDESLDFHDVESCDLHDEHEG